MAESNKGLQVTIGDVTYSLEGFADPVEALSVISDYLRGLDARGAAERPGDPVALRQVLDLVQDESRESAVAGRTGQPVPPGGGHRDGDGDGDGDGNGETAPLRAASRADRRLGPSEPGRRRSPVASHKAVRADRVLTGGRLPDRRASRDDGRTPAPLRALGPLPRRDAGFAGFISAVGQASLSDVVDAATAWLVREGTGAVTRSRILGLAARVMSEAPERGAALRCFEALVVEQRIRRVGGDRFSLGPTSRFAAGAGEARG